MCLQYQTYISHPRSLTPQTRRKREFPWLLGPVECQSSIRNYKNKEKE